MRYHRAGPIDDEDAAFSYRVDTYRVSGGVAERLDHSEEPVGQVLDEPLIDCIR